MSVANAPPGTSRPTFIQKLIVIVSTRIAIVSRIWIIVWQIKDLTWNLQGKQKIVLQLAYYCFFFVCVYSDIEYNVFFPALIESNSRDQQPIKNRMSIVNFFRHDE